MLITSTKSKKRNTEWENLNIFEQSTKPDNKTPKNTQETKSKIFDEYTKLSNSFSKEYVHQIEVFSKLQESYSNMYSDYLNISYNFFQLSFDLFTRLNSNSNIKKNKKSD